MLFIPLIIYLLVYLVIAPLISSCKDYKVKLNCEFNEEGTFLLSQQGTWVIVSLPYRKHS